MRSASQVGSEVAAAAQVAALLIGGGLSATVAANARRRAASTIVKGTKLEHVNQEAMEVVRAAELQSQQRVPLGAGGEASEAEAGSEPSWSLEGWVEAQHLGCAETPEALCSTEGQRTRGLTCT